VDSVEDRFGEYSAGGKIGSIREVSGRGDPGRLLICGGGVIDIARGEWYVEEGGEGDAAGEEYSREGLVTRFGILIVVVKAGLDVSSSEVAVSTSLSSCVKNEGSPLASCTARDEGLSR
jgi:hypothetical protein